MHEIGLGRDGAGLANERRADDPVRIGVLVTCTGSSVASKDLPLIDEVNAS